MILDFTLDWVWSRQSLYWPFQQPDFQLGIWGPSTLRLNLNPFALSSSLLCPHPYYLVRLFLGSKSPCKWKVSLLRVNSSDSETSLSLILGVWWGFAESSLNCKEFSRKFLLVSNKFLWTCKRKISEGSIGSEHPLKKKIRAHCRLAIYRVLTASLVIPAPWNMVQASYLGMNFSWAVSD